MFDLFRSRDKAVRYLLGALLGLVALSMVVTLIPGFGAPGGTSDQVIAEIGGDSLTVLEVQNTIQAALRGRQVPPEMVPFYVPQIIDQMITERAVAYQANRMGFQISDEEVASAIRSMLSQYFPAGEIPRDQYQRFLSQQGMTVDQFERNVRQNLLLLRLQNIALEGAIVMPQELEKEFRRRNEKAKLQYVKWTPPADLRSQVSVSPEDIRSYYQQNQNQFTVPEKRSFHLLVADQAKIAASFQVPEEELRRAYTANADQFRTPERVHARHILIKTTDKKPEEVAAAETKARELLKQIRGGADFAELAKKNSDDPGSAVRGGDLDWITRGQTVPNFEKSAFSLQPKQISDLIKTEYGFHIIQVLEKEQARVKPFEEVREQLAGDLRQQAVQDRLQQSIDQARAELAKNPGSAQQIAQKYDLAHYQVQNYGSNESIPEIGTSPEMDSAVAGLKANDVTQPVQVAPTKMAIAAVTQVTPARPAQLPEVENQIREQLIGQRVNQLVEQRTKEVTEKLRAVGGDLQAAAKQLGTDVKATDFFGADTPAEGIGQAAQLEQAFVNPVGHTIGPFTSGGNLFLAKVIEKQQADMSQFAGKRDELLLAMKQKKAGLRKELFEDGLLTQLIREGKVKKNQDSINRLIQGYRG